jgi:hypothetical protein
MTTPSFKKHALILRAGRKARPFIPALEVGELSFLLGKLAPAERKAMAQIAETADLLVTEVGAFLLVPADAKLLDSLAAFGAATADRENDLCDEPSSDDEPNQDDEPDQDDEPSLVGGAGMDQTRHTQGVSNGDLEGGDDIDREHDCPEAREPFAAARRLPEPIQMPDQIDPDGRVWFGPFAGRYDATKDLREFNRIRRLADELRWRGRLAR